MSAVLEQYFQLVVVDKINEAISRQFQEIKDDLSGLKKIQSDYINLRIEIEGLKKRISDSSSDIKEMLAKNDKKAAATRLEAPAVAAVKAEPADGKKAARKPAAKRKTRKKKG